MYDYNTEVNGSFAVITSLIRPVSCLHRWLQRLLILLAPFHENAVVFLSFLQTCHPNNIYRKSDRTHKHTHKDVLKIDILEEIIKWSTVMSFWLASSMTAYNILFVSCFQRQTFLMPDLVFWLKMSRNLKSHKDFTKHWKTKFTWIICLLNKFTPMFQRLDKKIKYYFDY